VDIITDLPDKYSEKLKGVYTLAHTCGYEPDHTQHVSFLADRLFSGLTQLHNLGVEERFWLFCAGILHNIGWVEGNKKKHHKISRDIILSSKLIDFNHRERLIIGSTARYHRKALPDNTHSNLSSLSHKDQQIVYVLSSILRLSTDMAKIPYRKVIDLQVKISDKSIKIFCEVISPYPERKKIIFPKADLLHTVYNRKVQVAWKLDNH